MADSSGAQTLVPWKQELLDSYSSLSDLLEHRLVSPEESKRLEVLKDRFKVRVTPYYAKLFDGSPRCPIRLQAIPDLGEEDPILPEWATQLSQEIYGRLVPWHTDPIGDLVNLQTPRLTHRYKNRAILHLTSLCAVYCRFCFRKSHLGQSEEQLYTGSLEPALQYLRNQPEIRELILTGGDPLSVTEASLQKLLRDISGIPHIKTVRIHSRMAVTLPSRFTSALLDVLGRDWPFTIKLVSHFNHPRELTEEARRAFKEIRKSGIVHMNQSVLLRDVNASVACLSELFQGLYEEGVVPFYLHHPDWTPGTFHFRTSIEQGREIYQTLKGTVPGPALPHYVLDLPQGHGKTPVLDPSFRKLSDCGVSRSSSSTLGELAGAVYEALSPSTRFGTRQSFLYLDLFHI